MFVCVNVCVCLREKERERCRGLATVKMFLCRDFRSLWCRDEVKIKAKSCPTHLEKERTIAVLQLFFQFHEQGTTIYLKLLCFVTIQLTVQSLESVYTLFGVGLFEKCFIYICKAESSLEKNNLQEN